MATQRAFGWLPDARDPRDYALGHSAPLAADITRADSALELLELHREVSKVRDQGRTSSCVGHAVVAAVEVRRALDGLQRELLSPLASYWGARGLYGFAGEDAGAYIRGGMKWAQRVGLPPEHDWPMDDDTYWSRAGKTKINRRPAATAEVHGVAFSGGVYERITEVGAARVQRVLDCIQLSCPVVFGFGATEAVMNAKRGETIKAPAPGERRVGGHAVTALAFDRSGARVKPVNSWGEDYCDDGYMWMEAEWFADPETGDLWALRPKAKEAA